VNEHGLNEIEAYLENKISEYQRLKDVPDDDIPVCTAEERWEKATKYAVQKSGAKRAYKLLDTQEEAEKLAGGMGKGYVVEKRPGEAIRCLDYCVCAEYCNFFKTLGDGDEEDG
jgi:hypothetical protein